MIFILEKVRAGAAPAPIPPTEPSGTTTEGRIIEAQDGVTGNLVRFVLTLEQADALAEQLSSKPRIVTAPGSLADAARRGPKA